MFVDLRDFGHLGGNDNDHTPQWQAAIDACRSFSQPPLGGVRDNAITLRVPSRQYSVSNLDCTHIAGLRIVGDGGAWGPTLYAGLQINSSKPVFDFIGSSNCVMDNIHVAGLHINGSTPTYAPNCAFLLGETTTATSDKMRFDNCRTSSFFTQAALMSFGCTNTNYFSSVFANNYTGGYAAYIGMNNVFSLSSAYQTIKTNPIAATENAFFGCEFHARNSDNTGTVGTIFLDDARTMSMHGGIIDNGTSSGEYFRIRGSVDGISLHGTKQYSETGTNTQHFFNLDPNANLQDVVVHGGASDSAISGNFVNGQSGATASNIHVRGRPTAQSTTNLGGTVFS